MVLCLAPGAFRRAPEAPGTHSEDLDGPPVVLPAAPGVWAKERRNTYFPRGLPSGPEKPDTNSPGHRHVDDDLSVFTAMMATPLEAGSAAIQTRFLHTMLLRALVLRGRGAARDEDIFLHRIGSVLGPPVAQCMKLLASGRDFYTLRHWWP